MRTAVGVDDEQVDGVGTDVEHTQPYGYRPPGQESPYGRQPSYGQPMEKLTEFGQSTPLGRAGQPAELAPAFVFLASAESSYVIGETLNVNGGEPTP